MNKNKVTKIIKFSAAWCGPCRAFSPTFKRVSEMDVYKGITFQEIDIEKDEEGEVLAAKYDVKSIPTTVLMDENGEQIYKLMGNVTEKDFMEIIDEALKDK